MTKNDRSKIIKSIYIGLSANILLTLLKLGFGIWGGAQSLVSDGINSLSDIFMSLLIFFVLKVSTKKPDKDHPYGHQKFEGLAYFTMGIIFSITAIYLGYTAITSMIDYAILDDIIDKPNILTLYISIIALIIKIFLAYFYFKLNKKYKNPTLKAEYKNHFYDIFSTGLTVLVLTLSQVNLIIFDYIGSLIISFFILRLAVQIIKEASSFLVDQAPSQEEIKNVEGFIKSIDGVLTIDDLRIRKHMTERYVDVEIGVLESLSLKEAHDIAEVVHQSVEKKYKEVIHCMVHVNPHK
ncbi:MAG: cation diffusion facilitator family transporter [Acholeplasmataceae bacterium]